MSVMANPDTIATYATFPTTGRIVTAACLVRGLQNVATENVRTDSNRLLLALLDIDDDDDFECCPRWRVASATELLVVRVLEIFLRRLLKP